MTSYMGVESVSFILFWWNIYNSIIGERFKYQLYSLDGQIDDSHHWGLSINDLIWLSGLERKLRKFPLCRANFGEAIIFPHISDYFRSVDMSLIFWRLVDDDIMLRWCRCTPRPHICTQMGQMGQRIIYERLHNGFWQRGSAADMLFAQKVEP